MGRVTEQHPYAASRFKEKKEGGSSLALALPSHLQDGAPVCYRLPLCSWYSELPKFGCRFAVQKYAVDRMVFVPEDLRISSLPNLPADQRNESGKLRDRGRSGVHERVQLTHVHGDHGLQVESHPDFPSNRAAVNDVFWRLICGIADFTGCRIHYVFLEQDRPALDSFLQQQPHE